MRFNWRRLFPEFIIKNERGNNIWNCLLDKRDPIMPVRKRPLWDFAGQKKPDRILEIGLGDGQNAMSLMALSDCDEFYEFDILHQKASEVVLPILKNIESFQFFEGDTRETLPEVVDDLPVMDLIFIDGDHSYEGVKNDWKYCRQLVDDDTVVFLHDYQAEGIRRLVGEIDNKFSVEILDDQMPEIVKVYNGLNSG